VHEELEKLRVEMRRTNFALAAAMEQLAMLLKPVKLAAAVAGSGLGCSESDCRPTVSSPVSREIYFGDRVFLFCFFFKWAEYYKLL
jgi:hypothetical protein